MKDWIVLETQEDAYNMRVVAGKPVQPEVCPRCGVENPRVYKHDQQDQTFMDTPMHGKRVGIQVVRQRWRCLECGKTFQQLLPEMDEKRNMTRRLVDYIQQRSLVRTFTEVADDVGVNEKTVRNVFSEYVALLEQVGQITKRSANPKQSTSQVRRQDGNNKLRRNCVDQSSRSQTHKYPRQHTGRIRQIRQQGRNRRQVHS
jgi:transposase